MYNVYIGIIDVFVFRGRIYVFPIKKNIYIKKMILLNY